ncbi:MmcQ/YjbR family DNA-binding protein [Bailinhaonella thermotolerans]|uniref:MmcQ/YjbR family DNA-binding protein n=1 Tax=Bailinhaonella thermotolerans TaxID=1070861 RepID=A0A3A4A6C1_9ACTN|nr:MmcQ/YjbR family DNA-binding protein [Bailinhaonella thermotolerans]RJL22492.1 MmcQ/YjbR family DNA-binding protein [Bailinhaonella thermotolerans]
MVPIQTVREMAMSLPEVTERPAWGMPCFRVREKIFVSVADDEETIGVAVSKEDRAALCASDPAKFFYREGHDTNYNWMRVRLSAVDPSELRELITDAWRLKAPKRLVTAYDAAHS